jgi:hypothetical protein
MKQAMYLIDAWERGAYAEEYPNEIAALRQAIEQAENQTHTDHPMRHWDRTCPACLAEQKEWVGLTDEERLHIGLLHADLGRGNLSVGYSLLSSYLSAHPRDAAVMAALAGVCERLGRRGEQLQLLARAADISPNDPALLELYAWTRYTHDRSVATPFGSFDASVPTLKLTNTIIAGNQWYACDHWTGSSVVVSGGHNLIQDGSCNPVTSDIITWNPLLGPLSDNGGPTWTQALLPGSPAINNGNTTSTADQRGFPRPFATTAFNPGNGADIGAVEINPANLYVINNNDSGAGSLRQAILDNNGLGAATPSCSQITSLARSLLPPGHSS